MVSRQARTFRQSLLGNLGSRPSRAANNNLCAARLTMLTLFWDIETRSVASLRDCGAHVYSLDPTTEIHCVAYAIDDGDPQLWLPGDDLPAAFSAIEKVVA